MVKLLAEKYDGIACEENYQDRLLENLDTKEFPNLTTQEIYRIGVNLSEELQMNMRRG